MDVVRELRRKQDDLKADRKALVDQIAEIDRKIVRGVVDLEGLF